MVNFGPVEALAIYMTMFEDRNEAYGCHYGSGTGHDAERDIHEILELCPELPAPVKNANPSLIEERLIDESLLSQLTNSSSLEKISDESLIRFRKRQKALSPYLDSILICVFIRVPGGHYTIEINPVDKSVVHWEWQQTQIR